MPRFIKRGLLIVFLFITLGSCQKSEKKQYLTFLPKYQQSTLTCGDSFEHAAKTWRVSQFQFYIFDLQLQDKKGTWHPTTFKRPENMASNIALMGGICGQRLHWSTEFSSTLEPENQQALKFKIGVPFKENHANPLTLKSPLNEPSMFWTWQTGHKFLRVELISEDGPWIFHLGSTGCSSTSSVRAPKSACLNPNVVSIQINDFKPAKPLVFRLETLLEKVDMADTSCKSNQEQESCRQLLANLGLNGDKVSVVTQD